MSNKEIKKDGNVAIDMTGDFKNSSLYFDWVIPANPIAVDDNFLNELNHYETLLPDVFKEIELDKIHFDSMLSQDSVYELAQKEGLFENHDLADKEVGLAVESATNLANNFILGQKTFFQEVGRKLENTDGKSLYLLNIYFISVLLKKVADKDGLFIEDLMEGFFAVLNHQVDKGIQGEERGNCQPALIYPIQPNRMFSESYDCTSLSLAQLQLIDTTEVSWEHIMEFREDADSTKKLRKLRLFFHENYAGKDKNYVKDDLLQRIEDYHNTAKDWGFEMGVSSLSMLLTSPLTLASMGTSFAIILFGEPLSALATAGAGMGLEIGKISLNIAKEKRGLSKIQRDHPIAYIIDAKKKLS